MADNQVERRTNIEAALRDASHGDLTSAASSLLAVLGYKSDRTPVGQTGDTDGFLSTYPRVGRDGQPVRDGTLPTQDEEFLRDNARSLHILFQYTDDEIPREVAQTSFLADQAFSYGRQRSFLFVSSELSGGSYPRGRYAAMTREINRRFPAIPAVVLFRTATGRLTVAFVHRRPHKRDETRDVFGSVSLIREIDPDKPHRAHLDILSELSVEERIHWIRQNGKSTDFDGLLAAWLYALDTEELNRRFYGELKAWFDRAIREATFPTGVPKEQPAERHAIRLITRLLFVWFIKEKGLVAEELFVEVQVRELLKDYSRDSGDSYYRTVLQNLFFATLNTPIDERAFRERGSRRGYNEQHRVFSRFRYESEIADSDRLVELFAKTPFINGGLFDCLDSLDARGPDSYRIDYFSDNVIDPGRKAHEYGALSIPNPLFFDDKGLISIFNHYRFTVEENTPVNQEVALDPELLGKAFENLLASVNPETGKNARKQSGSYYTPRVVVDYMVDEALVAALMERLNPAESDKAWWEDILRYLLDYSDAGELFDDEQKRRVIRAIADLRILDPAVGSGAFPMGMLHKLTLALRRLDPDNKLWRDTQRDIAAERADAAFWIPLKKERDEELEQISDTFERYGDSDFGRKLYLIQRCIFGVDNDPNATEIAKLRFFISLAIEQESNTDEADNYGIRPLPNLETRFVTADSLRGLERLAQLPLGDHAEAIRWTEGQLVANRESYFHAGTRREKQRLKDEDTRLRGILASDLEAADFPPADARKIAQWQPMEQGVMADSKDAADWFDPEFMFGVRDGFDIVIGNPPYAQLQRDAGKLGKLYKDAGYETLTRTGDIYQLFIERGLRLLDANGILAFITSNSWLKAEYGKETRRYLTDNTTILRLLEMGKDVFEKVIVDASVCIARAGKANGAGLAIDLDRIEDRYFPPALEHWNTFVASGEGPWPLLTPIEQRIMDKMNDVGTPLKEWDIAIYRGITTGLNDAFIIDNETKDGLIREDSTSAEIIKPILQGEDIRRWRTNGADKYLLFVPWHFPLHESVSISGNSVEAESAFRKRYPAVFRHLEGYRTLLESRNQAETGIRYEWYALQRWASAYHHDFLKEKLVWIELVDRGRFTFDESGSFAEATTFILTGHFLKYLLAFLNSGLIRWYLGHTAPTSGTGTFRWKKVYVQEIPIPKVPEEEQDPVVEIVDQILRSSETAAHTDIRRLESEVENLVLARYGLTQEEVRNLAYQV